MSFLVLTEGDAYLLDAGTGIGRLLNRRLTNLLQPYECLNIILSHYHLDHVVGLSYLPGIWTQGEVRIYAPGQPFVETVPEEALNKLLQPPLFSLVIADFPFPMEIIPVTTEKVQIGALSIQLRAQKHPGGSMGIRIADLMAYVTDTVVEPATQSFVQDVRLLLHEVWLTDAEAENDQVERSRHSYVGGVAKLAKQARVGLIMPIHHHPKRSAAELCQMAEDIQRLAEIEVLVPEEEKIFEVG